MLTNVALVTALAGSIVLGPPPTDVKTVVDVVHGVRITDDYRWLETLEAESEAVEQWTILRRYCYFRSCNREGQCDLR